jgi:hypothetical protein
MSPDDLLQQRDVQELVRVDPDGKREPMLRVPTSLLLDAPESNTA